MKYFLIFILALFFAGCGANMPMGELQIETPKGNKVGCVTDYGACTQTCYGTQNGFKVKKMTPLDPRICLEAKGETPAP